MEYDKLANEKTEMQRHYVMVRGGEGRVATPPGRGAVRGWGDWSQIPPRACRRAALGAGGI